MATITASTKSPAISFRPYWLLNQGQLGDMRTIDPALYMRMLSSRMIVDTEHGGTLNARQWSAVLENYLLEQATGFFYVEPDIRADVKNRAFIIWTAEPSDAMALKLRYHGVPTSEPK